jgi:hypothetical protein
VSGASPRMLTYICTLLVVLIAIGPLMIVWSTILPAQIAPSVPSNNATRPFVHIVVVVEENHSFSGIVGNPQAGYINSLGSAGVLLTNYHAVSHPSEPSYFALYAGSTFGVQDDGNYSEPDPTLATILQGNGEGFVGYVESGSPQKHNPWESFPEGMSVERNMSTFPANDFSQLPNVSFVIPNLNGDMHDGRIAQADQWLSINIDAYAQWAVTHQSLLMVVWDEDDGTEGNQVPAILYGANIVPSAYNDAYTHYNLLHTLLDASGLSAPRNAALVPVIWQRDLRRLDQHAPLTDTHDFNSDGKSDVVWNDDAGDVGMWLMNGAQILQGAAFNSTKTNPGQSIDPSSGLLVIAAAYPAQSIFGTAIAYLAIGYPEQRAVMETVGGIRLIGGLGLMVYALEAVHRTPHPLAVLAGASPFCRITH